MPAGLTGCGVHTSFTLIFQSLVFFEDLVSNGHIFTFDHVDDKAGLLDELRVLGGLFLDQRLKLAASHEELVADRGQEVGIIREQLFFDNTCVCGASLQALVLMLLLALLDRIEDQLAASECIQIRQVKQVV